MKQIFMTLVLATCFMAGFGQTDEKGIVLGVERSTAGAFSKHDLVYLNAVLADNVTIITSEGNVITKEQFVQTAQNVFSATVDEMKVRLEGGVIAIVTGISTMAGKDGNGNAFTGKTRYTDILLKTKGQWQIISRQLTTIE